MRPKAMAAAAAILFGACMLLVGLLNLAFPPYGEDFLKLMSSFYPGFHEPWSFGRVILGTFYGMVDGAIVGYVFSWLYRWFSGPGVADASRTSLPAGDPRLRRAS